MASPGFSIASIEFYRLENRPVEFCAPLSGVLRFVAHPEVHVGPDGQAFGDVPSDRWFDVASGTIEAGERSAVLEVRLFPERQSHAKRIVDRVVQAWVEAKADDGQRVLGRVRLVTLRATVEPNLVVQVEAQALSYRDAQILVRPNLVNGASARVPGDWNDVPETAAPVQYVVLGERAELNS